MENNSNTGGIVEKSSDKIDEKDNLIPDSLEGSNIDEVNEDDAKVENNDLNDAKKSSALEDKDKDKATSKDKDEKTLVSTKDVKSEIKDKATSKDKDEKTETKEEESLKKIPEYLNINDLRNYTSIKLAKLGEEIGITIGGNRPTSNMIFDIVNYCVRRGTLVEFTGVLDLGIRRGGILRGAEQSFEPRPDDIYIPLNIIKDMGLKEGNLLKVKVKSSRGGEKFLSVHSVLEVEEILADDWVEPTDFNDLTACHPSERIVLENGKDSVTSRIIDLISPPGKGQRALIAAPPRGGKTVVLKNIADSIVKNYKDVELMILLLDERPEEVTDFKDSIKGADIYASTFDEMPSRHTQVSELVISRAKRLLELGKDVIILLDSLTRLARAYNVQNNSSSASLSGGLSRTALDKPRRFFSSARKTEEKGSLTIIATALIETESRADEIIFEEFKGTGNMEIHIDSELAEKRIFPAIHFSKSGTRNDNLLYHPDEYKRVQYLKKQLSQFPGGDAIKILINNVKSTSSNAELLLGNGLKF